MTDSPRPSYNRVMEKEKNITIDELGRMVQRGFTETKGEVSEVKREVRKGFDGVNTRLANLDARVGRIEADIKELRGEVVYRHEFEDALGRIKYLEKKLGVESGAVELD